jgi:hypothetical protein
MLYNGLPDGAQMLVLDPEKLMKIWNHFNTIPGILDDYGKERFDIFQMAFYSQDSVWIERTDGNGLLYATSIIPHLSANVHFVYWDRHLAGREQFTIDCLRWVMHVGDLKKVNAWIPHFCSVAHKFARKLGFKQEGYIRNWSYSQGKLYDILCFGMTKEEVFDGIISESNTANTQAGTNGHVVGLREEPVPELSTTADDTRPVQPSTGTTESMASAESERST